MNSKIKYLDRGIIDEWLLEAGEHPQSYSPVFKDIMITLILDGDQKVKELKEKLKVHHSTIYRQLNKLLIMEWVDKYTQFTPNYRPPVFYTSRLNELGEKRKYLRDGYEL